MYNLDIRLARALILDRMEKAKRANQRNQARQALRQENVDKPVETVGSDTNPKAA